MVIPKHGSAEIIAESHRCVLRERGLEIADDVLMELARNAAHALALASDVETAEAESPDRQAGG